MFSIQPKLPTEARLVRRKAIALLRHQRYLEFSQCDGPVQARANVTNLAGFSIGFDQKQSESLIRRPIRTQ